MRIFATIPCSAQFDDDFDLDLAEEGYKFLESIPDTPDPLPNHKWPTDANGEPFEPVVGLSYRWEPSALLPSLKDLPKDLPSTGVLVSFDPTPYDQWLTLNKDGYEFQLQPHWINRISPYEDPNNPWLTLAQLGEPQKGQTYDLRIRGNPSFPWAPTGNIVVAYEGRLLGGGPGERMIFRHNVPTTDNRNSVGIDERDLLFIRPHRDEANENGSGNPHRLQEARELLQDFLSSPRGERMWRVIENRLYPDVGPSTLDRNSAVITMLRTATQWLFEDTLDNESLSRYRHLTRLPDEFREVAREFVEALGRPSQTASTTWNIKQAMSNKDASTTIASLLPFLALPRAIRDRTSLEDWLSSSGGSLKTAQSLATALGKADPKEIAPDELKALNATSGSRQP